MHSSSPMSAAKLLTGLTGFPTVRPDRRVRRKKLGGQCVATLAHVETRVSKLQFVGFLSTLVPLASLSRRHGQDRFISFFALRTGRTTRPVRLAPLRRPMTSGPEGQVDGMVTRSRMMATGCIPATTASHPGSDKTSELNPINPLAPGMVSMPCLGFLLCLPLRHRRLFRPPRFDRSSRSVLSPCLP